MAFWSWSKTSASNATADSTINWAEGQAPSSVNDSARAMMARTAEWRDDVSGTITTAGTSTAYTVTSNQGFDTLAHMAGAMIAFVPHTTSGSTVTLNVDGLGPKPLRSAPSIELGSGTLVQGTPYGCTYNNVDGAFYLRHYYGTFGIPIGAFLPYSSSTAPNSSFVIPYGQAISRTTYATYFGMVSTTFGSGNGTTTFNVPDLRGRTVFGLDVNTPGSFANRITSAGGNFDGTILGGTGGGENHTLTTPEIPAHNHTDSGHVHSGTFTVNSSNIVISNQVVPNTGASLSVLNVNSGSAATIASPSGTANIQNTGGGGAHTVLNPAIVLPWILRVI